MTGTFVAAAAIAAVVCVAAVIGVAAGIAYTELTPLSAVSSALVVLSPNARDAATQARIADSKDVLANAESAAHTTTSLQDLSNQINVTELASGVLLVQATASTGTQAEGLANAVANSYIAYTTNVLTGRNRIAAQMLAPATTASTGSRSVRRLLWGGVGGLAAVFGAVIALLAVNRRRRRLRLRDEIANATGAPVVASLSAWRATRPRGWAKVLGRYEPSANEAWQLAGVLRRLDPSGAAGVPDSQDSCYSVTVLSLAPDHRALALGTQLAVFAAGMGIKTRLVIGPHQDAAAIAGLRIACAAYRPTAGKRSQLDVSVADPRAPDERSDASLTVVVATVDEAASQTSAAIRTNATLLAVSPGTATAKQLARIARATAAEGKHIDGLLIADPDKADKTSGNIQVLTRPRGASRPTRITDVSVASMLSIIREPVRTRK